MEIKITKSKIKSLKSSTLDHFPKYSTYLINQSSQTAQSTRPSVVGQLSEEYPEYEAECRNKKSEPSLEGWKKYHQEKFPNAVENAVRKTSDMLENFRESLNNIDDNLIKEWVEDLLYDKTYYGFNLEAIIRLYFINKGYEVRKSNAQEESRNIDLFINGKPFQIKPESIDYKQAIKQNINVPIITYKKMGDVIMVYIDEEKLEL
jgi:hypothetical protein